MAVEISSSNVEAARQILEDTNPTLASTPETVNASLRQAKLLLERLLAQHGDALDLPTQRQASQPHCAFLNKLCYDVRHKIYSKLLVAGGPVRIVKGTDQPLRNPLTFRVCQYSGPPDGHVSYTDQIFFSTNILRTCERIYKEAMPVLYAQNTFALVARDLSWLERIGYRSIGEITSLILCIPINKCGAWKEERRSWGGNRVTFHDGESFNRLWLGAINLLSMSGKHLRRLELSFDNHPADRPTPMWIRNDGGLLHAFSWTLQIRIFKAIARIRSISSLRILNACPTPVPAYLAASMGLKTITRSKNPNPYPWHLEKLVERVKEDIAWARDNGDGDGCEELLPPDFNDPELDKNCGFYYTCYEDVKEAVEFQKELDDLGIKEFTEPDPSIALRGTAEARVDLFMSKLDKVLEGRDSVERDEKRRELVERFLRDLEYEGDHLETELCFQ